MSNRQRAIRATLTDNTIAGHWRVIAYPPGQPAQDVTLFRGTPIQVGDHSFTDPFGPQTLTLTLPQVTMFEQLGQGDLTWLRKHVDLDIHWVGPLPATYPFGKTDATGTWIPSWTWEGYITNFDFTASESGSTLTVQAKGAMLQLDNYLAKPEYPQRPLPYEWAIARQFLAKPALRLAPLKILWPTWWPTQYTPPSNQTAPYLIPAGVTPGQNWTGLLTRSTGSWDPTLTSYIQTLLQAMYSERGRWTLSLDAGRQPQLEHLDFAAVPDNTCVLIDPAAPGVTINLSEDWEQALTTVYGQGTSLQGVAYSGMNVSNDGGHTFYTPMAASRQVWPTTVDNGWLDESTMPREVLVQMQQGLSAADATQVARAHHTRFAEPGYTGTITLATDPTLGGTPLPRHLIRAGMKLWIPGLFGRPEGLILHAATSTHSISKGTTELTVDTKYRDALTVDEVRLRGRDSLSISRMLVAGQYKPPVDDQLVPWNYAEGSGYIPSNSLHDARKVFDGMPDTITFPWTDWIAQRPPSDPRYASSYLRLTSAKPNADLNWITQHNPTGDNMGVPIRLAQSGQIRLLQVAAYWADGTVAKVPFHIGFYTVANVNVLSMPEIPAEQAILFPPYLAHQHYPYVRDGFETYNADGTQTNPKIPHPTETVGLIRAYGTFYEKAGYFPGAYSDGDAPTGLLVDETVWPFDTTTHKGFDPYTRQGNLVDPLAGQIYAMIYCDAQGANDIYFLGRMYRVEPGTS